MASHMKSNWWNMYEKYKDGVYVCDLETSELVYMNERFRKMFNIACFDDYRGKKCYEVLQGLPEKCEFCNNNQLKFGEMYQWIHLNELTNKRFLLRDSIFEHDERIMRIEFASCIDDDCTVDIENNIYFHYTDMVSQCVKYACTEQTPSEAIKTILKFVVERFKIGCSLIFTKQDNGDVTTKYMHRRYSHLNLNNDLNSELNLPIRSELWDLISYNKTGYMVEDIKYIEKEYPIQFTTCKGKGVENFILEPLIKGDEVIGFIGAINMNKNILAVLLAFYASISWLVASLMSSEKILEQYNNMMLKDDITGAKNSLAFKERSLKLENFSHTNFVLIYCQIINTTVKETDSLSFTKQDCMLKAYEQICKVFESDNVFRIEQNNFIILDENVPEIITKQKLKRLEILMNKQGIYISIGTAWSKKSNVDIDELIKHAKNIMYSKIDENIKQLYQNQLIKKYDSVSINSDISPSEIIKYLNDNKYDMENIINCTNSKQVPCCICFGDIKGKRIYISDNMRDKFGFKSNVIYDFFTVWASKMEIDYERRCYERFIKELTSGKRKKFEMHYRVLDANNTLIWVHSSAVVQIDEKTQKPIFYTSLISWHQNICSFDRVTGFANDVSAINCLEKIRDKNDLYTAVAFKPNHIREFNETFGRNHTDRILKSIAYKLEDKFGDITDFFRLDGLRFLAITKHIDDETDNKIAEKIKQIIDDVYKNDNVIIKESCTVAILHYPCKMEAKEFVGFAITSLTIAKNRKKEININSENDIKQHYIRSTLSLELSKSVMNNFAGFRVVVQPIVCAKTGQIVKGEVLLRWQHDNKNISPTVFVPILEENDLMIAVGKWVFEQTVRLYKEITAYKNDFSLSFNVSYLQISDDEFVDFMEKILVKYNVDASKLIMELTESHFDESPKLLDDFIKKCRRLGIVVALDDFGNGYSTLGLLLKYPADIIKLDKSILENMSNSEDNAKFIKSIIYACHEFGKTVVTEGVETEEESNMVCSAGSDFIQGYYYHKPLEINNLHKVLLDEI